MQVSVLLCSQPSLTSRFFPGTSDYRSNSHCITFNSSVLLRPTKFETPFSNQILPATVYFIVVLLSSKELNWTTPSGITVVLSALSICSLLFFFLALFRLFKLSLSTHLIDYPDLGNVCHCSLGSQDTPAKTCRVGDSFVILMGSNV